MCQEYASCEWETPYGRTVSFSDDHREEVPAMSYHPPPCICPPFPTIHLHPVSSQQIKSFLSHNFRNLDGLSCLAFHFFSQHFQDSNFISSVLLYLNINSRPGKWTSSVFWFLIDGLRDRDPRHWDSGQRWLDLQSLRHRCRQAPSLGRHCPTLCW